MTLQQTLAAARDRLIDAGIAPDEAAVDVDLYARTILGWTRAQVLAERGGAAPPSLEPTLGEWVARRAAREPTAYILGTREFWSLDFDVSPAVLIPRPESELIVEEALRLLAGHAEPRVADIGTGSGNLAVSIAHGHGTCSVLGTDVSGAALAVAARNACRHGVADRVSFLRCPYLDDAAGPPFDLIAANPPYVRDGDKPGLSPTVRHEPDVALFGGVTGLRDIEGVLDAAHARLTPAGWLVMEFGLGQEDVVRAATEARGLEVERMRHDLQGIARTAVVRRRHTAAADPDDRS